MRKLAGLALVVGPALYVAHRGRRRERVELVCEDGSAVTLVAGSPDADALLRAARQAL